ncbi:MAG: proton-conducting transporter membrane subunit, partial [Pseudomonadota bacterium]|nr:proton-conducting transporter membrane subunit [Pseudomonadota bacterium]
FRTGEMRGSELGGLYKSMPKTTLLCIIGAASISAFPLFSGFVSKSMVMVAVLEEGHTWVWLALLFASAGVFHHAGIKIPFFAFFAHDSGIRVGEAPQHMLLAMGIAATLSLAVGFFPGLLYDLLPYDLGYSPYDSTHVLAQLQLLFFSALAFTWLKLSGIYPPELCSVNLDVDWFYRRLAPAINSYLTSAATQLVERIRGRLPSSEQLLVRFERRALAAGRTWSIQTMIGAVMFALALLLLVYFSSNGFSNP